ncbi:MAG: hypothetical protein KGV43_00085 [Arcobacter sp.]|nr:hypothetical protein [Arcobacter sp.]
MRLLSVLLSLVLIFSGCGGGDSSSSSSSDVKELDSIPFSEKKTVELFNKRMVDYADQTSEIESKVWDILKNLTDNFTSDFASANDEKREEFYIELSKLNDLLDENLFMAYNLINILNSSPTLKEKLSRALSSYKSRNGEVVVKKRFLVTTAFIVGGIALSVGGLVTHALNKKRIKLTIKNIKSLTEDQVKAFNEQINIPRDTTKEELLDKFNNMNFVQKIVTSNKMNFFVSEIENFKAMEEYQNNYIQTGRKLVTAAVTAEVGLSTTATGGQYIDKAASFVASKVGLSPGLAEIAGKTVDLVVSYAGTQPLDIVATMASKTKKKKTIPSSNMPKEKALEILKDKDASVIDKEKARNKIQEEIAQKSGLVTKKNDSNIEVTIPEKMAIKKQKDVKGGDIIKMPSTGSNSDITIVTDKKIPELIKNMKDNNLKLEPADIEEYFTKESLNKNIVFSLHQERISKSENSITYEITARIFGVKEPLKVKISSNNAKIEGSKIKTIQKDGDLSWKVTVSSKDADVLIELDNGQKNSVFLLGTGIAKIDHSFDGNKYVGTYTKTDDPSGECESGGSVKLLVKDGIVDGSASASWGEVSISGYKVRDAEFSGTADDGTFWKGKFTDTKAYGTYRNSEWNCGGTWTLDRQEENKVIKKWTINYKSKECSFLKGTLQMPVYSNGKVGVPGYYDGSYKGNDVKLSYMSTFFFNGTFESGRMKHSSGCNGTYTGYLDKK